MDLVDLHDIINDHFKVESETRRRHPREMLVDVSVTDYECFTCHTAWSCDASLIADKLDEYLQGSRPA